MIVRRFTGEWLAGYMAADFTTNELELLDPAGKLVCIAWSEIKWVCLVRELPGGSDKSDPERLLHKRFSTRPRAAGVWLRLMLNDCDLLEGLAANDLSLLAPNGLLLTPPDIRSNTQRIFVPRLAIAELEVVALISNASHKRPPASSITQPGLFPPEPGD